MTTITLRQYHEELNGLLKDEALETVIGHCRHILRSYPRNVDTYRLLGRALLIKARFKEAGDIFLRVLSACPDDLYAHAGMAEVYKDARDWPRAVWHLERAFEQDPNNAAIQDELRDLYDRLEGGERNKTEAPRLQMTRGALARMYLSSGLPEKAVGELQNILRSQPDRIDLKLLLARSLADAGHPVESAEVATDIVRTLPYCLEANRILAEIWLRNNRPSDALPFLRRVESLSPYLALELAGQEITDGRDPYIVQRLDYEAAETKRLASVQADWMSELGDALQKTSEVSPASVEGIPDWMRDLGRAAQPVEEVVPPPSVHQSSVEEALQFNMADVGAPMPGWMADVERAARGEEPEEADPLAWLTGGTAGVAAAAAAAPGGGEQMPPAVDGWDDISQVLGTADLAAAAAPQPAPGEAGPDLLDWMADLDSAAADEAAPLDADWLAGMGLQASAAPVPDLAGDDLQPAESPDWLRDMQVVARQAAEQAQPPDSGMDDLAWLLADSGPEEPAPSTPTTDMPAYRPAEPGERIPTGFTSLLPDMGEAEDPLSWLSAASGQPVLDEDTDQLRDSLLASPGQTGDLFGEAADDSLAWLGEAAPTPSGISAEDGPPAAAAPTGSTGLFEFLASDTSISEEAGAATPAPGSTDSLAWLYAADEEEQPELEAVEEDPLAWLYSDAAADLAGEAAPSEAPPAGPSAPEEAAAGAPLAEEPAEFDLATLEPAEPVRLERPEVPAASSEIPDWLAEAGPEAAPGAAEAAEMPVEELPPAGPVAATDDSDAWLDTFLAEEQPEPEPVAAEDMGDVEAVEIPESDLEAVATGGEPPMEELPEEAGPVPAAEPEDESSEMDWLSAIGISEASSEPAEAAQPAETAAWLAELGLLEETPAEAAPGADAVEGAAEPAGAAEESAGGDWLSAIGILSAETAAEPPAEEAAAAEAISRTGAEWLGEVEELTFEEPGAIAEPEAAGLADLSAGMESLLAQPEAAEPPAVDMGVLDALEADMPEFTPEEETAEPAAVPDWLSAMGAPEEEAALEEEAAEEEFVFEAAGPAEVPDWLSAMGAPEEEAAPEEEVVEEEFTFEAAEPAAVPDWLSAMGAPEEEAAPEEEVVEEEFTFEAAEPAAVPDWLSAMGAPEEEAAPEEEVVEEEFTFEAAEPAAVPDWLSEMGAPEEEAAPEEEVVEEEFTFEAAEPAAVPDWLSEMGTPEEEAASEEEAVEEEFTFEAVEPAEPAAVPDWLSAMGAPEEEVAPEEEAVEEEFTFEAVEPAEPAAVPDWLSAMGAPEEEAAPEEEEVEEEFTFEPAEPDEVPAEVLDWLNASAPEEAAPEEEEAAGLPRPAWLAEVGPLEFADTDALGAVQIADEVEAAPEELPAEAYEAVEDLTPGQETFPEEEALPEEEAAPRTAAPAGSIHETLEWLSEMGALEEEPERGLQPGENLGVAEDAVIGPDWLKEVGALAAEEIAPEVQEEAPPAPEPAPSAPPRFDFGTRKPAWMRGAPPRQEPAEESPPGWLADSGTTPDWLQQALDDEDEDGQR